EGKVQVLSAETARSTAVKHLFLAGLSEQALSSAEQTGRLYDERDLSRLVRSETPPPEHDAVEQRVSDMMLLFYELVTRASHSLTLSFAALDERGQVLPASPLVDDLRRCFPPGSIVRTELPLGGSTGREGPPQGRRD